jgi:regulator of sigma E protease
VAVACGVKVLRFSVGFGKTLYRWQPKKQKHGQDTEFVIGAFPLGGYVKMLDEREGPVAPEERHLAFNTQPLKSRAAIVAAGPAANLLLAVLLYAIVNWYGVQEPKPILASPVAGSVAEQAGLRGGELVQQAGFANQALQPVRSFEDLRWLLTRAALDGRDVRLQLGQPGRASQREALLPLSRVSSHEADAQLFRRIGILGPYTPPVIGDVIDGGAAQRAGLRKGDVVLAFGGTAVVDGQQLRELIRNGVDKAQGVRETWRIQRDGQVIELAMQPDAVEEGGARIGRIGAYVGAPPEWVKVRTAHHRRLRRQVGQPGIDAVPRVPRVDQRQPRRVEPAAAAGLGWWAPDVLSLGGRHGKERLRRLDGAAAAWRGGGAAGDDDDRAVQRRHASLWLTLTSCDRLAPGAVRADLDS